ncbi:hypothetical protein ACLKA7_006492 [Drosophila subpalustris]
MIQTTDKANCHIVLLADILILNRILNPIRHLIRVLILMAIRESLFGEWQQNAATVSTLTRDLDTPEAKQKAFNCNDDHQKCICAFLLCLRLTVGKTTGLT